MVFRSIKFLTAVFSLMWLGACGTSNTTEADAHDESAHQEEAHEHGHEEEGGMGKVHLSAMKVRSLDIRIDTIPYRALSDVVFANGQLQVPPQYEATVTAVLGGNITSIKVMEGDRVRKGQILAYLAHPDLVQLQSDYAKAFNQLQYLEKEYERQKRLYEEEVGSGQRFQEVAAQYEALRAEVKSYEAQLKQLGLNVSRIQKADFYQQVPIVSPINGYIEKVWVQIGQFVAPTTAMFAIVNTDKLHADLMVFEKDVALVKEGQMVSFRVESAGGEPLRARIFAVGKQFEQNPKALHVHAEILDKRDYLIPGMYINGRIEVAQQAVRALPEEAIVDENGVPYIFVAEQTQEDGQEAWVFEPVEIRTGDRYDGWVEVKLLEPLSPGTLVAWSGAYYLVSEMQKGELEHSH